ncbi:MAG: YjbH domain-containing protein [Deltaproteobacteria bacterium]|nr:YjbH domain-containing protein [Deltaproteobacteria bacterium]
MKAFGGKTRTAALSAVVLLAILLQTLAAATPAAGGDEPFTYPSNLGLTGLLETPTARVMKENRYRVGASWAHPYRTYFGAVGIFPRIEISGRITEVIEAPVPNDPVRTKNYKDKAVDIKLQILPEGKYSPAIAVALLDPHGTRLFASQAIVASKQIYPFDFSIGIGNGRYGRRALPGQGEGLGIELIGKPREWLKDAQAFGGIQFAPTESFALVAEYSSIRYHLQTGDFAQQKYFQDPVPSPFNFGVRWKPVRWAEIDASWQRGNQAVVAASVAFDIGKPLVPIYDHPYREPAELRRFSSSARIAAALGESGFSDIGVDTDGMTLHVEVQNDRYYFNPRAIAVIIEAIAPMIPGEVEYVRIMLKENGIPLVEFVTTARGIAGLSAGEISTSRFLSLSAFLTDASEAYMKKTERRQWFSYGAKPSLETFLNDPSGYVKYRFGILGWLHAYPWKGGSAILGVEGYPVNTASLSTTPLSIPVRSDISAYKREEATLGRLMFEQIVKAPYPAYGKISGGLLEVEYAGVDGEMAIPLLRGRAFAGIGGSFVKKRDPGYPFRLTGEERFHTTFLNARINVPEYDVHFDIKAGRFLAGDKGARFTFTKTINGVSLSAWYSVTDTSIFSDSLNRGYNDKGISVDIPIRLFTGHDSKTSYRYAISPWTRDVAQDVDHYRTLFDLMGGSAGVRLDKELETVYKAQR